MFPHGLPAPLRRHFVVIDRHFDLHRIDGYHRHYHTKKEEEKRIVGYHKRRISNDSRVSSSSTQLDSIT